MTKSPNVSVLISAKNESKHIEKTINSMIVNTSYKNYEIIVVNDNSTDGTEQILFDLSKKHQNIKSFKLSGVGTAKARNMCFKYSSGDLIICSDAHITVKENWLEKIVEIFNKTNFDILSIPMSPDPRGDGDTDSVGYGQTLKKDLIALWLTQKPSGYDEVPIAPGGFAVYKREVFEDIGGYETDFDTWGYEDIEIAIKSWLFGYKSIVAYDMVVLHYFRAMAPFKIKKIDYYCNVYKTAFLHFGTRRILKVRSILENYIKLENPSDYQELLDKLDKCIQTPYMIKRRDEYFDRRKYSDEWYFKRFNIPL
jgi:glycosyltransferase involved in cell wall biosynthesis